MVTDLLCDFPLHLFFFSFSFTTKGSLPYPPFCTLLSHLTCVLGTLPNERVELCCPSCGCIVFPVEDVSHLFNHVPADGYLYCFTSTLSPTLLQSCTGLCPR